MKDINYQIYVQEVMEDFAKLTHGELARCERGRHTHLECLMQALVATNNIKRECVDKMTYLDIACMIQNTKNNSEYYYNGSTIAFFRFLCRQLAAVLTEAYKTDFDTKVFLSLPLSQFLDTLNAISINKDNSAYVSERILELTKKVFDVAKRDFDYDEVTLMDVISVADRVGRRPWLPENNIIEYQETVLDVHKLFELLLIRSFCTVFPCFFDMKAVIRKYSDSEFYEENNNCNTDENEV